MKSSPLLSPRVRPAARVGSFRLTLRFEHGITPRRGSATDGGSGGCDAASRHRKAIAQVPNLTQLLPYEPKADASAKPASEYAYEPTPQAVLEKLVPQAVNVKIYRGLLESWAAEHAARMAAMENATKNAGDMIGTLTLFYNRSRQALITKELMEIVSGAEALKG